MRLPKSYISPTYRLSTSINIMGEPMNHGPLLLISIALLGMAMPLYFSEVKALDGGPTPPPVVDERKPVGGSGKIPPAGEKPKPKPECPDVGDDTCTASGFDSDMDYTTAFNTAFDECEAEYNACITEEINERKQNNAACTQIDGCQLGSAPAKDPCVVDCIYNPTHGVWDCHGTGEYDITDYECDYPPEAGKGDSKPDPGRGQSPPKGKTP